MMATLWGSFRDIDSEAKKAVVTSLNTVAIWNEQERLRLNDAIALAKGNVTNFSISEKLFLAAETAFHAANKIIYNLNYMKCFPGDSTDATTDEYQQEILLLIDSPSDTEEKFAKQVDKRILVNKRKMETTRLKLARAIYSACSINKMEKEKYTHSPLHQFLECHTQKAWIAVVNAWIRKPAVLEKYLEIAHDIVFYTNAYDVNAGLYGKSGLGMMAPVMWSATQKLTDPAGYLRAERSQSLYDEIERSQASLTGKQVQECAAGAVTFSTTQWIMQHLVLRVQAYEAFIWSQWPLPLTTKHITAPGMVKDTKRVVMLLCTQHPAPALLLQQDHAVLCEDIIDASRAHNSALEVCCAWTAALGVQVEPVLIGPVTLSTLDAAVLVFAAPMSSSEDPLPVSLTPAIAQWTGIGSLTGLLRCVSDVAFAKLASFIGPCSSMSTLFSPQVQVGAVSAASVAVSTSAPTSDLIPFEYAVQRTARSTRHFNRGVH